MDFGFTDDQQEIKRTAHDLLANRSTFERVREAAEAGRYDDALWRELGELGWPGIAVGRGARRPGPGRRRARDPARGARLRAAPSTPFLGTALAAAVIEQARLGRAAGALAAGLGGRGARGRGRHRSGRGGRARGRRRHGRRARARRGRRLGARGRARGGAGRAGRGDRPDPPLRARASRRRGPDRRRGGRRRPRHGGRRRRARRRLPARAGDDASRTSRSASSSTRPSAPTRRSRTAARRCCATPRARARRRTSRRGRRTRSPSGCARAAALAKAAASDAGREVTASAIQAHGGIGFTWEADVHWLYKRAQLDSALLGGAGEHRARLARIAAERLRAPATA